MSRIFLFLSLVATFQIFDSPAQAQRPGNERFYFDIGMGLNTAMGDFSDVQERSFDYSMIMGWGYWIGKPLQIRLQYGLSDIDTESTRGFGSLDLDIFSLGLRYFLVKRFFLEANGAWITNDITEAAFQYAYGYSPPKQWKSGFSVGTGLMFHDYGLTLQYTTIAVDDSIKWSWYNLTFNLYLRGLIKRLF